MLHAFHRRAVRRILQHRAQLANENICRLFSRATVDCFGAFERASDKLFQYRRRPRCHSFLREWRHPVVGCSQTLAEITEERRAERKRQSATRQLAETFLILLDGNDKM